MKEVTDTNVVNVLMNDGVGNVWKNHDVELSNFIEEMSPKTTFEIGSGSGRLGKLYLSKNINNSWTALEPNHVYDEVIMPNFIHLREWFDSKYNIRPYSWLPNWLITPLVFFEKNQFFQKVVHYSIYIF